MKILVHDFAGHPFQFQLSRELAVRGHEVVHAYFASLPGPKGDAGDASRIPPTLHVEPLRIEGDIQRYSYFDRLRAHHQYFEVLKSRIRTFKPDAVLSGNTPTELQYRLTTECQRQKITFVHWIQDFYALALETLLTRKLGVFGKVGAVPFYLLERAIFRKADAVVYISDDFSRFAVGEGYIPKQSAVIENWANLEDLPLGEKDNAWSRKQHLSDKFVFLYSGTMGLKHSPETLVDLARRFQNRPDVRIVLVSEGIGRKLLQEHKDREGLQNLVLLNFQPYSELPDVLASANVLLANVEPESSLFCVPSKILSYLCAGRPVLLSSPSQNLGARVIMRAEAGYVCEPGQPQRFLDYAERLWSDQALCREKGTNARRYAEATFDISNISAQFEAVLRGGVVSEETLATRSLDLAHLAAAIPPDEH